MQYLICLLTFTTIVFINEYRKLYKTNEINYHNYKSCLIALSQFDEDLKNYLENEENKNGK